MPVQVTPVGRDEIFVNFERKRNTPGPATVDCLVPGLKMRDASKDAAVRKFYGSKRYGLGPQ